MGSKFIAIEGLDGAGKSTQIKLLIDFLETEGIRTRYVHFPRASEGVFGELISKFLRGEFGDVKNVHPQLVALLFAEDRKDFSETITQWLEEGYFVLVDRYVLSNIAFQCAKTEDSSEKKYLRKWINAFEYGHNKIPKPDLSIYLDVPLEFTHKSLNGKRGGSERAYLNGMDDIHEKDMQLQVAVKAEYDALIESETDLTRIVCYNAANAMKPVQEIHAEIVAAITVIKMALINP
jgi:dTMP kinase